MGGSCHGDFFSMAAAYLFHIARNHPFVDGNKRTSLLAALIFLDTNGIPIESGSEELYEMTIGVAEGRLGKAEIESILRRLAASG